MHQITSVVGRVGERECECECCMRAQMHMCASVCAGVRPCGSVCAGVRPYRSVATFVQVCAHVAVGVTVAKPPGYSNAPRSQTRRCLAV